MPPNIPYGTAEYEAMSFPDCGENSLRNFFNIVLWDKKAKKFDVEILKIIAENYKTDVALTEADFKSEIETRVIDPKDPKKISVIKLHRPDPTWPKLKQLIWFYSLHPKPVKSQESRNQWTSIVSNISGIKYAHFLSTTKIFYEIPGAAGISNILDIIGALIPDSGLRSGLDSARRITRLCELFSSKENPLMWRKGFDEKEIKENTCIKLNFFLNNERVFEWEFMSGHVSLNTVANRTRWQDNFGDFLLHLFQRKSNYPQLTFYLGELNYRKLLRERSSLFWTLAYSQLHTEEGLMAMVKNILKNKTREYYGLAETLMKRLPTGDKRIQLFILEMLLYDKEELSKKGSKWIQEQLKKELELVNKTSLYEAVNHGYLNILKYHLLVGNEDKIRSRIEIGISEPYTFLTIAVTKGHLDVVMFLVEKGVGLEERGEFRRTPLICAAFSGDLDIVKFLVEKRASLEVKDSLNSTALMYAVKYNYRDIDKFLKKT